MKNLALRLALTLAVCCSAFPLNAQTADVSGGSLTIAVAPALANRLLTQNVTASAYTPAPYDWTIPFLGVQSGMFDLAAGNGSFSTQGNFVITNADGSVTLSVTELQFEALGKKAVITGTVMLNGHGIARMVVFELKTGNPFTSPTVAGSHVDQGLVAILGSSFSYWVTSAFGVTVPPGMNAGIISYNVSMDTIAME